jgi:hypothetical protein
MSRRDEFHSFRLHVSMAVLFAWLPLARAAEPPLPKTIDFNRDIRPIFSENCYQCHGPDKNKRKAHLRLDTKEGLFVNDRGRREIVPGQPEQSELFRRITTSDRDERMPDPKSGKTLSPPQIAVIKKWIEQGAEWKGHWAYLPPVRPELPMLGPNQPARNAIDRLILTKLQAADLRPSPEADRVTLIRRLCFDLEGLPPTQEQVAEFLNDPAADAYERLVDRLLDSPHYGERMAMYWLDLVRYADSIGYHSDNPMPVAPYRDYVIRAFNTNKPFDRFTIEQLAGDLLPSPTLEQKIASAYNRLLQTTEEGGAQAKEYEAKYAADRVRNASTVWLGTTMGCCQCHDHKFDPFTMRDFYSFAAFFADVQEAAVGSREQGMPVLSDAQADAVHKLDLQIAALRHRLETPTPDLQAAQADWEKQQGKPVEWQVLQPSKVSAAAGTALTPQPDGSIRAGGTLPPQDTYTVTANTPLQGITAIQLEVLPDAAFPAQGPGVSSNGNFVLTEFQVAATSTSQAAASVPFKHASADFSQTQFPVTAAIDGKKDTGWAILPQVGKAHTAIFETSAPLGGRGGTTLTVTLAHESIYTNHNIGRFRLAVTTASQPSTGLAVPAAARAALAVSAEQRSDAQRTELATYFRSIAPQLKTIRDELAALEKKKTDLTNKAARVLVTTAAAPRTVRILPRGNWLDDSGEVMAPAVPRSLPPAPATGGRATRLDVAHWLVSRNNPLTARVFMNRLWKLFFGQGLSKTLDDLGSQGEWPTHPELLDWLAIEFMDSGWNVKDMVRLLVTSATYRQSSQPRPDSQERDPYNRLYARQARFRLDAEMVRDNALVISGLLAKQVGGRSVKPYQPPGYWYALNFPPREWQNDQGANLYRRGLYTHWQRTFLHPSLLAFDAPTREECTVERPRSNIPQQALVLLNDPTYVEAARAFAERILRLGGTTTDERLTWAYERALSRAPRPDELRVLAELLGKHASEYAQDKSAAQKLVATGAHPAPVDLDVAELAGWTSAARVILNLHETITRY